MAEPERFADSQIPLSPRVPSIAETVDTTPPLRIITDDIFLSYTQCPYKAYLKLTGRTGTISEYELSETDALETYRSQGLERALNASPQKNVIDCAGAPISALPSGFSLLLRATLQTSSISSNIDLIEKVPRTNSYIPVLYSPSKTISSRDRLALGFKGVALSAVQGKEAQYGKIVHGSTFSVTRLKLQMISKKTRSVITALTKVADGMSPPRLLLNRHCNTCEFQAGCQARAFESDDLSLLRTLKPKDIAKLNKKGIFTITQYAFTFRPRRKRRKLSLPTKHDAALKALAIRDGQIYVNRVPPIEKRLALVFLDVEGVPDQDFYYLIGLSVFINGDKRSYSFWANDKAEEERIWKDFLGVLAGLGSSYWIFHFGSYETQFVAKMLRAYGSHSAVTPEAITGSLHNDITYYHLYLKSDEFSALLIDARGLWPIAR
jgi:predicted RecB family nuclease